MVNLTIAEHPTYNHTIKICCMPNVYIEITVDHFVCWDDIWWDTAKARKDHKTMTAVYFGATDADKACDALVSDLLKVPREHCCSVLSMYSMHFLGQKLGHSLSVYTM